MCGIFGYLGSERTEEMEPWADRLSHRGPDDEGTFRQQVSSSKNLLLSHRRLSIVGLDTGAQPMTDTRDELVLIYNGEIYNYPSLRDQYRGAYDFRTNTDGEILFPIYRKYGIEGIRQVNGMFAFALWDRPCETLFLVRDRLGIKPLYYTAGGSHLTFASEIKALLNETDNASLSEPGVYAYLQNRYVPGPETLLEGVKKLPPATYMTVDDAGNQDISRYWSLPDKTNATNDQPREQAQRRTEELFESSVKHRLMSDVPLGVFLSGGVDSSLVTKFAAQHTSRTLHTFTASFDWDEYNEAEYARRWADQLETNHSRIEISTNRFMKALDEVYRYRDVPVTEPSDLPMYVLAKRASETCKVILTGEGSDELFGGYPKYGVEQQLGGVLGLMGAASFQHLVPYAPMSSNRREVLEGVLSAKPGTDRYLRWFGGWSRAELAEIWRGSTPKPFPYEDGFETDRPPADAMMRWDLRYWLPDNLLERGDRMLMAHSLENRVPFLDHRLVEHMMSVPVSYKFDGLRGKRMIREMAKKHLPEWIWNREKQGFPVPVGEWFRTTMRSRLTDDLVDRTPALAEYVEQAYIRRIVKEHLDGKRDHRKKIWTLLSFELWHEQKLQ